MSTYLELQQSLQAKRIGSYFQNPELLVVSNAHPAMPNFNSFWMMKRDEEWYLGTWLPAVYLVPAKSNLSEICDAVLNSSQKTIYTVNETLAAKLNLHRLTEAEIEVLGFNK